MGYYDAFVMCQTDPAELTAPESISCKFPSRVEILLQRISTHQLPLGTMHVPFLSLPSNANPGAAVNRSVDRTEVPNQLTLS